MREILFRGKRVDNGEWVEGFYVFVPEHHKPEMSRKSYIVSINNGFFFEVIPETVGQYTGLTDKNGKKIFEGDVIETSGLGYKQKQFEIRRLKAKSEELRDRYSVGATTYDGIRVQGGARNEVIRILRKVCCAQYSCMFGARNYQEKRRRCKTA